MSHRYTTEDREIFCIQNFGANPNWLGIGYLAYRLQVSNVVDLLCCLFLENYSATPNKNLFKMFVTYAVTILHFCLIRVLIIPTFIFVTRYFDYQL